MGFERFGKINYTAQTKVKDFVSYLESGKIEATQCRICKKAYFPPQMDCNNCLSTDQMDWKEIANEWTLLTYTKVHFAPTGFEEDTPYILVIAESKEGLKTFARLSKDVAEDKIAVGMKLRLVPIKLPNEKTAYEFRPVT
jgi:uncharacterized OB-fold protein